MLEIFQYDFMINAFIVYYYHYNSMHRCGCSITAAVDCWRRPIPCVTCWGSSRDGIWINPILSAVIFAVFAALSIEKIRKAIPRYGEISTAVITSVGVALAAILSVL